MGGNLGGGTSFFSFVIAVVVIVGMWKVFVKGGYPGWGAIIPIYNIYIIVKLAGYSGIMVLLFFVPIVNFVFMILVLINLNKAFGQEAIMVLLAIFLPFIYFPLLGFGNAKYVGA